MDQFIVSARKYRPQTFDTVVGQSHITTTLKNAILQNQLAHAFLFCGPRGVGKTTCARILAKTINCEHRLPNGEACDHCTNCISFNQGLSLNIFELDAASNNSVDDIRQLTEQVRFAPQMGTHKVYIIDEVHMLSSSAFNAFLKTLEEPPPYALFILATTEKHKILPTILSRCQIFDFRRITPADTVAHLETITVKEGIQAEKSALEVIARKSEGCMRDSLSILDKIVSFSGGKVTYHQTIEHLNILDADTFFLFLEKMQAQELSEVLLLFDEINQKGFEGDVVLNSFAEFLRNLLVSKDDKVVALLDALESFKQRYQSAARNTSASWIVSALSLLNEAEIQYKQARNKRLHVEMALIKLTYLSQVLEAGDLKKKSVNNEKPIRFRQLKPYTLVQKADTAFVENKTSTIPAQKNNPSPTALPKLTIQKPTTSDNTPTNPIPSSPAAPGRLSKIREKIAAEYAVSKKELALTPENIEEARQQFLIQLKSIKKFSAATNFEMMSWNKYNQNAIEMVCTGDIQMGFLKQEKTFLIDFLQQFFNNTQLTIEPVLIELQLESQQGPAPLSTKEQYFKLIEKYPQIQKLKEKLGLELDY